MLTRRAKYAFKALVFLAESQTRGPVQIEAIAAEAKIPRRFLEHILLELKRGGFVVSRRGRAGGYALAKRPRDVTIGGILRVIDGPIAPLSCISRTAYRPCRDCPDEAACAVRRIFASAYEATLQAMDATTIADGLAQPGKAPHDALRLLEVSESISAA